MSDLRDLYQELILEHSKSPRNFGKIEACDRQAEGMNALCGDHLHVYVKLAGATLDRITFEGQGCAICTASASVMTQALKGKTEAEAEALFLLFHELVTTGKHAGELESLGKLAVFAGVHEFPVRVKCASLAWHTLRAALAKNAEPVTTE